ncbi:MAG: AEC family transporter, partial [Clostridia bacterium]|nr:AEC family transporter [Clostridia bacterium]
ASTLLIMVVALVVFKNKQVVGQKIYQIACMLSNCGFFGLPFLAALFPGNDHVILYASMYIIVFNLVSWTLGIFILTGDKKYISVKKALANPAIIFSAIGFVLFLCKVTVPAPAVTFTNFWSTMTSPVAMTVTGIRLADMPSKVLVSDWRAYVVCALRLLVAPALTWCMLTFCGVADANLFNTLVIACAMPVAATTVVFAEAFTDAPEASVTTMLLSTVLCIVTIPVVSMLFLI